MKGKVFTAQEVQAILNGSKVMFREVIKPYPHLKNEAISSVCFLRKQSVARFNFYSEKSEETIISFKCPYQVGQKIFCKETFCLVDDEEHGGEKNWIDYRATPKYAKSHPAGWDNEPESPEALKWKPAQHMKQEHSRIILQIKSIGVEKLADISEEDAIKEGNYLDRCECLPRKKDKSPIDSMFKQNWCHIHGEEFKDAWNSTHKKPEEKFEASPWIWKVEMEVVK